MKVPRDLNGGEVVKVLRRHWNYRQVNQEGSHIVLETDVPTHHRLAVPNHSPIRVGTLNSIIRAVAAHKNVDRQAVLDSLR